MKVLKIMVNSGAIFHLRLQGFPDAEQVELVDMNDREWGALPAQTDEAFNRARQCLGAC